MSIFGKIFGDANEKVINEMRPVAEEINNLEKDFEKLNKSTKNCDSPFFKFLKLTDFGLLNSN